jgi:Bacterial HORMA domain family 1
MTTTYTKSTTFTIVHARYLASKVAADMQICARYYGTPSESEIRDYAEELAQYLNEGFLKEYEFGFQRDGKRLVSWLYKVDPNGLITTDDHAGKVAPYVDISGGRFFNYLTRNSSFFALSPDKQTRFESELPVKRATGNPPRDGSGQWVSDRNYFSGGCGLNRQTFQPIP